MERRPLILAATSLMTVAAGVVWYLEPLLGGLRMDQLGIPRAGAVLPSPVFLLLKLALALLAAVLMWRMLVALGVARFVDGARSGAVVGLIGATFAFDSAQAGQPLVLVLTDGVFMVLVASATGALLAQAIGRQQESEE